MKNQPLGNDDAQWMRDWRSEHGLHQHQVAAILDENQGRISEIEHGQRALPDDWRQKLKDWPN